LGDKKTKLQDFVIIKKMKKNYHILIILIIIFAVIGFYLGWLDNGPEF